MYHSSLLKSEYCEEGDSIEGTVKSYLLNYYLLEQKEKDETGVLFGVRVEMETTKNGICKKEFCHKAPITTSKAEICDFITALSKGRVTPTSFDYIVDEYDFTHRI